MATVRPLRYYADNPGESIPTSYNTGLGVHEARNYAVYNARVHGGRVIIEFTDGTREVYRDYRRERPDRVERPAQSPEETVESVAVPV